MTAEPSPRPWHFNGMRPTIYSDEKLPDGSARVVLDIETDHLPLLPCDENDRQLIADLALIVDAVNERDRLRDLVKRMAHLIGEKPIDWFGKSFVETQVLLSEARAAVGEANP